MSINIIKKYLTKVIALTIITTSIIAFNCIGANATWKQDNNYISKIADNNTKLSTDYREYSAENMPGSNAWNIPKEPYYEFYVHDYDPNGEVLCDICEYLVGKESKNVYVAPNQDGMSIYQIKNNQKVQTFKYIGEEISYEWH